MITAAFGPLVTVVRRTITRDVYGHATTTETNTDVRSLGVAPRASSEQQAVGRGAVLQGLTAYLPPGTTLDPDDRLLIGGLQFEVEGEPGVWSSPFTGETWGVEVALKRATG